MSTFWLSHKNYTRTIQNIMALFAATDSDLDGFESVINILSGNVEELRQTCLNPDTSYITDVVLDSSYNQLLDSSGAVIESRTRTYRTESLAEDIRELRELYEENGRKLDWILSALDKLSGRLEEVRQVFLDPDGSVITDEISDSATHWVYDSDNNVIVSRTLAQLEQG